MSQRLQDRVCVVTGSSRGIGAAIARALAQEGATLVVTYRTSEAEAQTIADETRAKLCIQLDVTDRESVRSCFAHVADICGRIDVLVNNAGINRTGGFDEITDEMWDDVVDTNLKGVFLCCQEALPFLPDDARIINIGSVSGQYGGPRTPSYAAAKAGVIALTHCLARFLGTRGITVNCVSPGVIQSEMLQHSMSASLKATVKQDVLLERFGTQEEVAALVCFLATPEASYITGQTVNVNGGIHLS